VHPESTSVIAATTLSSRVRSCMVLAFVCARFPEPAF
jgi:hypothetical protein